MGKTGGHPQRRSKIGDGQYLYLSTEYFDRSALGGISIAARILLKYLTITTFTRGFEGELARSFILRSRLSERSLDRRLYELQKARLIKCLHRSRTRGRGSRYRIAQDLVGRGEGFTVATNPYKAGVFACLTLSELYLFECLSFQAYSEGSFEMVATVSDLMDWTGLSEGTCEKAREKLFQVGLLDWDEVPRPKAGNEYLINPVLFWRRRRGEFHGFQRAAEIFNSDHFGASQSDHFGAQEQITDHFGASFGSFWRLPNQPTGTNDAPHSDLFGADHYSCITSYQDDAARQMCPNGQDLIPQSKGALRAFMKSRIEELKRHMDSLDAADVESRATKTKKKVSGGGKSNSHARGDHKMNRHRDEILEGENDGS